MKRIPLYEKRMKTVNPGSVYTNPEDHPVISNFVHSKWYT